MPRPIQKQAYRTTTVKAILKAFFPLIAAPSCKGVWIFCILAGSRISARKSAGKKSLTRKDKTAIRELGKEKKRQKRKGVRKRKGVSTPTTILRNAPIGGLNKRDGV